MSSFQTLTVSALSSGKYGNEANKFPRLQSARFEPFDGDGEIEVNYKSGAHFKGQVQGHKKIGRGIFIWPNGARYEGDYMNNMRTGKGMQLWADGSRYEGQFQNDNRHGEGEHTWTNKESYKGRFFQDRRHGNGLYRWPDGSTFKGTFYMDRKEGYGVFTFANGNIFEGLYKEDEREGPGVLSYTDGKQDVGLWHGERLVKICSGIPDAFTMKNHTEFDYDPKEHVHYLSEYTQSNDLPMSDSDSPTDFMDSPTDFTISEKVTELINVTLDPQSLAVNKEIFDQEFFHGTNNFEENFDKIVIWNRTPSVIALQKHVEKHKKNCKLMSYDVNKLIRGDRSKFKDKGPLELASEELMIAAMNGNVSRVEELLATGKVSPNVADKNGHTALIGASVNWHMDVINCLLNHGADVNKLTDEGCSALSAGSIFFYPTESFRYNIAERYIEKPTDKKKTQQPQKPSQSQQPKSILTKKSSKKSGVLKSDRSEEGSSSSLHIDGPEPVKPSPRQQVRIHVSAADTADDQSVDREKKEEFDSEMSMKYYEIEVTDHLIDRCATQLSINEKIVAGQSSKNSMELGTVRHLAVVKNERERMKSTLDLLLKRGADPNASGVPMPVLFFAIKAADVDMVKALLSKGASTSIVLPKEKGGLAPLHISCAIPGEEGVLITELLLEASADPDVRATPDDSFLNDALMEEWSKDVIPQSSLALLGGRTPLHIACARDDNYKNTCRVVRLLLEHRGDPNVLCNGFSPLALCIVSGNDLALDELLQFGADPSLPLTHGVGSALCAATNTDYEDRRNINGRLQLIDKLVRAGANILAPIPIGPKRVIGTAVDYAYYMFNQDRRIAHMPYHALTHTERETYNARRRLLAHMGDIMRVKAVERERQRLEDESREGRRSASPSQAFLYIGAGAPLPPDARRPKFLRQQQASGDGPMVTFETESTVGPVLSEYPPGSEQGQSPTKSSLVCYNVSGPYPVRVRPPRRVKFQDRPIIRKPLLKYCYECGRSVGVRLSACTRCKEVYYCSKACKLKAWNARHKEECIRIGARSRSPSPSGKKVRGESPTPATDPEKGRKTTVAELTRDKKALRIHEESDMESLSGMLSQLGIDVDNIEDKVRQTATPKTSSDCGINDMEVPRKGLSHSARGARQAAGKDARRVKSEHLQSSWKTPAGGYIDNYSYV